MRKLKLESLQVESFETTGNGSRLRGTVDGYAPDKSRGGCPGEGTGPSYCVLCHATDAADCQPDTYDVVACGDTQYFDCTFGCSQYNSCQVCWIDKTKKGCQID
jgi:hypothetical protein